MDKSLIVINIESIANGTEKRTQNQTIIHIWYKYGYCILCHCWQQIQNKHHTLNERRRPQICEQTQ